MPKLPNRSLEKGCPAPVAGIDEAGRGPWAGPVHAAAVILAANRRAIAGLNDSKQLTAAQREELEAEIKARALAWAVAFATVEEIAVLNIFHATGLAMRRAIEALSHAPAFALVDGNSIFDLPCAARAVVKGDCLSASIAAASILAKTARDRVMVALDSVHPGYGFAAHKGYGAPAHVEALRALGPSPIHRHAWGPVQAAIAGTLRSRPARRATVAVEIESAIQD